jgi:Pet100
MVMYFPSPMLVMPRFDSHISPIHAKMCIKHRTNTTLQFFGGLQTYLSPFVVLSINNNHTNSYKAMSAPQQMIRKKLLNTGGRGSFSMEAWKFAVYLAVPIAASVYFSNPGRMRQTAEYWKFVEYPANPNVGIKEDIIAAQKQWQDHHEAHQRSMAELHERNKKKPTGKQQDDAEELSTPPGFWRRLFGWGKE